MIPQDKANHCVIGALISAAVFLALLPFIPPGWAMVVGFVVACVAGLVKESADQFVSTGTPDPWDFYWTVFGAIVPVSVALATLLANAPQ